MQGARGGGEGAARAGDDAGGKKVDRGIFVFVGAASAICAEPGGRGSGQAGYGGGGAQNEVMGRGGGRGGGGELAGGARGDGAGGEGRQQGGRGVDVG